MVRLSDCMSMEHDMDLRTISIKRTSDDLTLKKNMWIAFEMVKNHNKSKSDKEQLLLAYNKLRKAFNYDIAEKIDKEWLISVENSLTIVIENPHVLDFAHKKQHKKTKCIII